MVHFKGGAAVRFGTGLDPTDMVRACAASALDDAGLTPTDVDQLVVANAAAEGLAGIGNVAVWTATACGLVDRPALRVETGPSSGLAALAVAAALVASGRAEHVLVLGWESMTGVPTAEATRVLSRLMAPDERRLDLSLPALVALLHTAYQARTGVSDEAIARVPVKAHALARTNPLAHFQREITVEEVLASRFVAAPHRLLHCAPLSDGAAGLVVGNDGPVRLVGLGAATDHLGLTQRRGPPERFEATATAAARAYADAGWSPEDVDVVELHDAFAVLEAVNLEDLGLAPRGAGLERVPRPCEALTVRPVVNPGGGLKARGHPVGATGVAQLLELFDQLTGRAANQVDGARRGLAHNIGGFGNNVHVACLEAAQ